MFSAKFPDPVRSFPFHLTFQFQLVIPETTWFPLCNLHQVLFPRKSGSKAGTVMLTASQTLWDFSWCENSGVCLFKLRAWERNSFLILPHGWGWGTDSRTLTRSQFSSSIISPAFSKGNMELEENYASVKFFFHLISIQNSMPSKIYRCVQEVPSGFTFLPLGIRNFQITGKF